MSTTVSPTPIKLDPELKARLKSEAFRQEATAAWEEYQATGLHVNAAKADGWLGKLEAGTDVKPPEAQV